MKPEVLRIIIGLLVIAIVLFSTLLARDERVRGNKTANLLYIVIAGLCMGVMGFSQLLGFSEKPLLFFIVLQALMLLLGIIHLSVMARFLRWTSHTSYIPEFLLTLTTVAIGGLFLLLALTAVKMKNFSTIMLSSVIWFLVPFFFAKAMDLYRLIPEMVFKTWAYPVDHPIPDPSDSELALPMVISFEFQKKVNEENFTIFRAKAPKDIQFGKLFYFFINDYNSRHPEGTIEVSAQTAPYPWVFHFKPRWFVKTRYLDPDETVYHNLIRENSVIVCRRIFEN